MLAPILLVATFPCRLSCEICQAKGIDKIYHYYWHWTSFRQSVSNYMLVLISPTDAAPQFL